MWLHAYFRSSWAFKSLLLDVSWGEGGTSAFPETLQSTATLFMVWGLQKGAKNPQNPCAHRGLKLVTSVAAFEHFSDVPAAMKEFARIVRPGWVRISVHLFPCLSG